MFKIKLYDKRLVLKTVVFQTVKFDRPFELTENKPLKKLFLRQPADNSLWLPQPIQKIARQNFLKTFVLLEQVADQILISTATEKAMSAYSDRRRSRGGISTVRTLRFTRHKFGASGNKPVPAVFSVIYTSILIKKRRSLGISSFCILFCFKQ